MLGTMISLPHNHMEMALSLLLGCSDPGFEDMFCFFYELAVEIYCVAGDTVGGVVFAEDVVRGLFIVLIYFCGVLF